MRASQRRVTSLARIELICVLVLGWTIGARGDQVEMANGDRYVGRVVSLGSDTLLLQSDVLGSLKLPRSRISTITLEARAAAPSTNVSRVKPQLLRSNNVAQASGSTSTNAADLSLLMNQLGSSSNLVQQVQNQLLTGAGPEAQAKFNDLLGGLLSGKMDLNGLRAEAKSTLAQAKRARADLGEEGSGTLDSYLAILESFLKESEPAPTAGTTNAPSAQLKTKDQKPVQEQ